MGENRREAVFISENYRALLAWLVRVEITGLKYPFSAKILTFFGKFHFGVIQ